ncbi:nucleotide-binding universal stress UspA family protein [Streptomyces aurantiacus]|uniref:universal stress protein n=1 Tax=Streptomyces aurantiacus TaxID=47760 RepID=UPI00279195D5|nr:universal stress protein [Streptomyces aurantiacus]MDQ0779935.1 nucleotide-binding universal stress UspA family protein [Streptomyces aurantiacus]
MTRTITVGLDGSPASLAAADWAAREAQLRDLPLRLVNAWERQPSAYAPATGLSVPAPSSDARRAWARRLLSESRTHVAGRYSGLWIDADGIPGPPVPALLKAGEDAELLVLGSRGLSKMAGFLVGSVSLSVLAGSERPVVVVRAAERSEEDRLPEYSVSGQLVGTAHRDVVLGLDLYKPDDTVIKFAFEAASRAAARLRVVHGWTPPPYYYGGALMPELNHEMAAQVQRELSGVLRPWQEKYPAVEVSAQATVGGAGGHLIDVSREAALVVVGRQTRRAPVGTQVGPVVQALLHHAAAPVAVIPYD